MTARCVMVLGTSSHAGKSFLTAGLCRWATQRGLRVAPFKAQNMSNNARVAASATGYGEMGCAQYFQALAAQALPDVRMNPVLLKPEADTRSQVVVLGEVRPDLTVMPWRERSAHLWPTAEAALAELREANDVLIIEGAGSPAEINLAASDYVNTRTALAAQAKCLLVTDIDRGGAFAHLYGTHALMDAAVRAQLRGFVLNKFRGDPALLAPAPEQLERLTGVPTAAVVPMLRHHGLPEEDGVHDTQPTGTGLRITVLAWPHVSNLDEFEPLRHIPGVQLHWARDAAAVTGADCLILPGSKNPREDLAWLRAQVLEPPIRAHIESGRPTLAICGGLQMLGDAIEDAEGHEGPAGTTAGLGLLGLTTRYNAQKRLRRGHHRFNRLAPPWQALSGVELAGYEIRFGQSTPTGYGIQHALAGEIGWQQGNILALYLHGIFENPSVVQALFGHRPESLDSVFDRLANTLDAAFHPGFLNRLMLL